MIPVKIRSRESRDDNFILNSWLKSYFRSREWFCQATLTEREYYEGHHRIVSALLGRCDVSVACNPDDASQIFGWSCSERGSDGSCALHYLYVKACCRGFRIGLMLFEHATNGSPRVIATHWTRRLIESKADSKYQVDVNPYYLWKEATDAIEKHSSP